MLMADDILATLTYDDALAFVGRTYRVRADAREFQLTITRVVRAREHGHRLQDLKRDSFSIFFRGPADVLLPQHMYDLAGESESFPNLFIVPVGRASEGYEYEAVFT
jgi:hypothetical protein